jgi:hypothetical protein
MRCRACDTLLTDFESTRKNAETLEFIDMCNRCFSHVEIDTIDRADLRDDIEDDYNG